MNLEFLLPLPGFFLKPGQRMRKCFLGGCFLLLLHPWWAAAQGTLDADESVLFFPTIAKEEDDGSITVPIEAWVFQEERRRVLDSALNSYLGIDPDQQSPARQALFAKRARYFHADSERGEIIHARIGDQVLMLPATDPSGRTHGKIRLDHNRAQWRDDGIGHIAYALEAPGHALHGLEGHAWILPEEGVFVVSDIDDTIKHSNVRDKKALLRNTFWEPFQAVPGAADWYRKMARDEPGIFFHYLSASPLQLHPVLSEFLREQGFPTGNLYLRESTAWRTLYADSEDSRAHKTEILEHLAARFPKRKFILIGDSGESDPEIYADFTRKRPGQVLAIYIRDVTGEDKNAPRYRQTFQNIAPKHWQIWSCGQQFCGR
ncbi:MAG: DUF2183 domain-containing protein [Zoogloeaceae bacterium]|jgi:hypothetical protein|nr:DUF2183 domain-containing protein [Zoogloeaceae bacterium]